MPQTLGLWGWKGGAFHDVISSPPDTLGSPQRPSSPSHHLISSEMPPKLLAQLRAHWAALHAQLVKSTISEHQPLRQPRRAVGMVGTVSDRAAFKPASCHCAALANYLISLALGTTFIKWGSYYTFPMCKVS